LFIGGGGPPPSPPNAPDNLAATAASASQINLAWSDNSDNESGFRIERCTGAGCTGFVAVATTAAGATSYSNTGLSASTTYRYRVLAFNAGGDSGPSNEAEATTSDAPPPPPNQNPTARYSWSCKNGSCSFNGTSSSDPDGNVVSYAWNFGDGSTGSGATVSHNYGSRTVRTVTLTVTDNLGGSDGAVCSVNATNGNRSGSCQ